MLEGHPVPPELLPAWMRRAVRRRQLLLLGVSLTEQAELPALELDQLMLVHQTYQAEEQRRNEEAAR